LSSSLSTLVMLLAVRPPHVQADCAQPPACLPAVVCVSSTPPAVAAPDRPWT
jgi:hypothetical protein